MTPSLLILGADAVLSAAPATPVQMMHACLAAGFDGVIPASWGDELIAARAMDRINGHQGPQIQCSCPHVRDRLATHGGPLVPMMVCMVAPPVAAAQYLRAVYAPARPHITFAGACPGAAHPSIDRQLSPADLMTSLQSLGISTRSQPTEFDSVIPPDRRRYYSDPGGVPARAALADRTGAEFVELHGDDVVVEIAQQLLQRRKLLIDAAPALGCSCSGASAGSPAATARSRVRDIEPPRAMSPVVDHSVTCQVDTSAGVLPPPPTFTPPSSIAPVLPRRPSQPLPSLGAYAVNPSATSPPSASAASVASDQPEAAVETPVATTSENIRTSVAPPELASPPAPRASGPFTRHSPPGIRAVSNDVGAAAPAAIETLAAQRRRSPPGIPRPVLGGMPLTRTDAGRQLPRAYVARRRSSPRDLRRIEDAAIDEPATAERERKRRYQIGVAGIVLGLIVAWLLSLVPRFVDWLISLL